MECPISFVYQIAVQERFMNGNFQKTHNASGPGVGVGGADGGRPERGGGRLQNRGQNHAPRHEVVVLDVGRYRPGRRREKAGLPGGG